MLPLKTSISICLLIWVSTTAFAEMNLWPLMHHQSGDPHGRAKETNLAGPFIGNRALEDMEVLSLRPFYTYFNKEAENDHWHILYPLWNVYEREHGYLSHGLNLLRFNRNRDRKLFHGELFPLLFYHNESGLKDDYYAFWPLGGTIKNRLFRDRIDFLLWPLYVKTRNKDETYYHFPYPFFRILQGPASSGAGVWPLYGEFSRKNDYRHRWVLWPLYYHYMDNLDEEVPYERCGLWPLYHRETAAGLKSESVIWPFFGYTRKFEPRKKYSETRYFWPFVVQGRGEEKYLNRLLPVYSHEKVPGEETWWYGWPLLKREKMKTEGFKRQRYTLLYFLFRDDQRSLEEQSSRQTTLWPLLGYWDLNGEQRQWQVFDPLSIFFPGNEKVRENWSPLFAVYRYDRREDSVRHSFLWNLFVWKSGGDEDRELYLGPLFNWVKKREKRSWEILNGLLGWTRNESSRNWKFLWHEF